MSILITIGIIAKNEAAYIATTLETLIQQNLDSSLYEIIVVDGNSKDKTRDIAKEVLESSNISFKVLNEKDFGFYGHCFARNLIIDHSSKSSKFIAYTDADSIVDEDWLKNLYNSIKDTDYDIAGAGGPRLVAPTYDMKELVINHFLTSFIGTGGNPAFSKRNIKFLSSIPNYNAIYKKDIISKFRYDDSLIVSDDNELNLRLNRAGYKFIYVINAKIYHRETNSIRQFARNMFNYGVNITNTIKKHKLFKIKVLVTLLFLFYLIFLIPLYLIWGWMILIPLVLYFIYTLLVFGEVSFKTKSLYSLLVFLLMPIQHIAYAYGTLYNLLFIHPVNRNNR